MFLNCDGLMININTIKYINTTNKAVHFIDGDSWRLSDNNFSALLMLLNQETATDDDIKNLFK